MNVLSAWPAVYKEKDFLKSFVMLRRYTAIPEEQETQERVSTGLQNLPKLLLIKVKYILSLTLKYWTVKSDNKNWS